MKQSSVLRRSAGVLFVVGLAVMIAWACYPGRMTGGGSVFQGATEVKMAGNDDNRVTHGFELHCDPYNEPNNLEINWNGNHFHLDYLDSASCDYYKVPPDEKPPVAGFNRLVGHGYGIYNNTETVEIYFELVDHGERGDNDTALIQIGTGGSILNIPETNLTFGNHQAHKN